MSSPSNLYAEKIFAEHPTVLWALDDTADYLSLISEEIRDISDTEIWTISGGAAESSTEILGRPFGDTFLTKLIPNDLDSTVSITAKSSTILSTNDLNQDMSTFSIGAYFYSISPFIDSIDIGYYYLDGAETIEVVKNFKIDITNTWLFLSHTFEPNVTADVGVIIRINCFESAEETPEYSTFINGLTLGQWSEEFNAVSLGVNKQIILEDIAIDATHGISAEAYGLQDNNGYYLVNNENQLMAKNTGMPLVFGARNNTLIIPNNGDPSLILPGNGFLNKDGTYKRYTFESWLRLNGPSSQMRRIIGPISSQDGIYVYDSFLYLKLDNYIASYYVGEWYRPMLLQLRIMNSSASLLVNGEQVILIEFTNGIPSFAEKFNESGQDQDWIGFYSYDDIAPFEIDCVALYSYNVPNVVAKRRWVYGQAVESPETINAAFSGTSFFADYQMANYSKNLTYPDLARWDNAIAENIDTGNGILSTPTYPLPTFDFRILVNEELVTPVETDASLRSTLIADNSEIQEGELAFIRFTPNENWENYRSIMFYQSLNFLNDQTAGLYLVVKDLNDVSTKQTLLYIVNRISGEYFEVSIDADSINYTYKQTDSAVQSLYSVNRYPSTEVFSVGVNLTTAKQHFGSNFAKFLSETQFLEVYIGNDPLFENQFEGHIYSINILNQRNVDEIAAIFDETGFVSDAENLSTILGHKATYSAKPRTLLGVFDLDISLKSSWQDYSPLNYFAKSYKGLEGETLFGIDFIQLNIDYPKTQEFSGAYLNTAGSIVKTYITFQPLLGGANADYRDYTQTVPLAKNNVIVPGSDWVYKRFEVADNTIIYPPAGININNIAIVYHIDLELENSLSQRIRIRKLELASQTFSSSTPNPIGTRLGPSVFPYKKTGVYFDYKSYNPFTIYKGSTPYLYLTGNSGFNPVGDFYSKESRGISVPINRELSSKYQLASFQMAVKFDGNDFPVQPTQIAEIQHKDGKILFFIVSDHPNNKRGRIYAIDANTGTIENRLAFYWNGNLTKTPMLSIKQWGMLGVSFARKLNFNLFAGAIRLTGPMTYNNISHYELTALQQIQGDLNRSWFRVKFPTGDTVVDWEYWSDSFTWDGVLVLPAQNVYGASPSDIFKAYTGTNKIIASDDYVLTVKDYSYPVYTDVDFDTILIKPV